MVDEVPGIESTVNCPYVPSFILMVTGPFTPFWANAVAAAGIELKLPDPDRSTEYDPDIGVCAERVKLVIKRVEDMVLNQGIKSMKFYNCKRIKIFLLPLTYSKEWGEQ